MDAGGTTIDAEGAFPKLLVTLQRTEFKYRKTGRARSSTESTHAQGVA